MYGPDTAEAVAKAQAYYGIDVDRIVGAMTVYVWSGTGAPSKRNMKLISLLQLSSMEREE